LEHLNRLDLPAWLARFGGVFEHSPWVAEGAWRRKERFGPFASVDELHRAMMRAVEEAPPEKQLALVRAHPELAGGEALTVDSTSEQGRLGFNRLSKAELEHMNGLNQRYREKFGFPCIVALRLHANRASVMDEMARRLGNNAETELAAALEQIGHITRGRLDKLLGDGMREG
jgi:2-oxo-4-hydroxy-4-carboxy-5-ureidoimidazoline decarboxylase